MDMLGQGFTVQGARTVFGSSFMHPPGKFLIYCFAVTAWFALKAMCQTCMWWALTDVIACCTVRLLSVCYLFSCCLLTPLVSPRGTKCKLIDLTWSAIISIMDLYTGSSSAHIQSVILSASTSAIWCHASEVSSTCFCTAVASSALIKCLTSGQALPAISNRTGILLLTDCALHTN